MELELYKKKRNFKTSPEPKGKTKSANNGHRFVVQKHDASHLHYDFRLEIGNTLKSWAVPKGPSMKSTDKRLAIMVEDHPLEYANFEGIIPEGNYGAGKVMVWDEGYYHAINDRGKEENDKELLSDLYSGNLKIILEGKKLKGEFALVKIKKDQKGKNNSWLLIKKKDQFEAVKDVLKQDRSVKTNRALADIMAPAKSRERVWSINDKAPKELVDEVKKKLQIMS